MGEPIRKNMSQSDTLIELYNQKGRRRVPRRPIEQRIGILIGGEYFLATSFEIGEGGMLIETNVQMSEKDKLVVTIRIPGVIKGVMLAKVAYVLPGLDRNSPSRYGVAFENVEFDVKRQIRNFVAANTGDRN